MREASGHLTRGADAPDEDACLCQRTGPGCHQLPPASHGPALHLDEAADPRARRQVRSRAESDPGLLLPRSEQGGAAQGTADRPHQPRARHSQLLAWSLQHPDDSHLRLTDALPGRG